MNNIYRNSFELNSKFVNREKVYRNNRGRNIEGGYNIRLHNFSYFV